jgi:hypothetical protein
MCRPSIHGRIPHGPGKLGLLPDKLQLVAQPKLERVDARSAALLANLAPLLGGAAA